MKLACGAIALLPRWSCAATPWRRSVPRCPSNVTQTLRVAATAASIAITGVTLIDGRGGAGQAGQTVVIRDGRIAEVGPAAKVKAPAGAQVVDGTGMTLIPGHRRACTTTCSTPRPAACATR